MAYRTWTDEQLRNAVKENITISGVVSDLGLKSNNSGNHQTVKNRINTLQIDTSHFSYVKIGKISSEEKDPKDVLIKNSSYKSTNGLKKKLFKYNLINNICKKCGQKPEWNGKKLTLHLDHINGDRSDNRLENLRLLCPNCHSQTETYCRGKRTKNINMCVDCEKLIAKKSTRCTSCDGVYKKENDSKSKINWPNINKLIEMVNEFGYCKTARIIGDVSDNAVRKRIKTRM